MFKENERYEEGEDKMEVLDLSDGYWFFVPRKDIWDFWFKYIDREVGEENEID